MLADGVARPLAALVTLCARGRACAAIAPYLAGGTLFAGAKADGGVRPLAAGEMLRRLTSRCLLSAQQEQIRTAFGPHHIGDALPFGGEIGVHVARAWHHRCAASTGKVAVKLDFRNAHNLSLIHI